MKKHDLVELTILGIGLWAAYQCVLVAFMVVASLVQLGFDGFRMENTQAPITRNIISTICYFIIAHFALRKTDDVMKYLKPVIHKDVAELGEEPTAPSEKPPISKADIMRIVVIGLGIILTIPQVPGLLQTLYMAFESRVDRDDDPVYVPYLLGAILEVLVPALLIIFSKRITASLKI